MQAHAFPGAVTHREEHGHLTFLGGGCHGVVAGPDFVATRDDDRARVRILWLRERARRLDQLRFPHQPQHPRLRRADFLEAQPRPHFAMSLTVKGRAGNDRADLQRTCEGSSTIWWRRTNSRPQQRPWNESRSYILSKGRSWDAHRTSGAGSAICAVGCCRNRSAMAGRNVGESVDKIGYGDGRSLHIGMLGSTVALR
jgi:hypothetical protein